MIKVRPATVVITVVAVLFVLVLAAITMVGWQVVLGPDARPTSPEPFEVTDARLERGRYLVESVTTCFHCHTEHDLTTPEFPIIQSKKGAGWIMPIPELNHIASRNITPDRETGIGDWTDDEVARAIREGVRRDGTALFPIMPYQTYAALSDEDVKSIVVYLRTIPAVRNVVPTRALPGPLEYLVNTMPKPVTAPVPAPPSATARERGEYLVALAECGGCHTPTDEQGVQLPGLAFAGGVMFEDPSRNATPVFSMNITPAPSGIAHYDESLFMQTLRTGQVGARQLTHIMPFEFFRNMTDQDLSDIFAHLRTLEPKAHRVSNVDPSTPCAVCGQPHGLGEMNVKR